MASKTIMVTEEVYDLLVRHKRPKESFSQELARLAGGKGRLSDFAGAWSDMTDEEYESMMAAIKSVRKSYRQRALRI